MSYNLWISAPDHTRGVGTLLIMKLKSLPSKGLGSLLWGLMKNPDRFFVYHLITNGCERGTAHISATHPMPMNFHSALLVGLCECCFAIHLYLHSRDITIYHWNKIIIRVKESPVTIYTWITVLSLLIQDMCSPQTHYLSEDKISQRKAWSPGSHKSTLKILSIKRNLIVWGLCLCICGHWRPMEGNINLPKGPPYGRLKQFILSCYKGQNYNQEVDSDSI